MSDRIEFTEDILECGIEGYHRYRLDEPCRLSYVSRSLCEMTGYSVEELIEAGADAYESIVHPEDREKYRMLLRSACAGEVKVCAQYRLIHKNGKIVYVQDTLCSRRDSSGRLAGHSTLADVTQIKQENEALHALNETVPCGILKYTCDESPRVTYVNEQMLRMLRFREDSPESREQLEQYKKNIYLLVPPEERVKFRRFLDMVYENDKPIAGEMNCLRCDGSRLRLYGWISRCQNAEGGEEFQSVCMDVTERYERKRRQAEASYLRALSQVYDEICELDLSRKTIRFLQGRYYNRLGAMAKMPLMMEEAVQFWIENVVVDEDRKKIKAAFEGLLQQGVGGIDGLPLQLEFRVHFSDQTLQNYIGTFLKTSGSSFMFCCRNISRQKEADALKVENSALRGIADQMKELVMRFTDGMLAFEICGDSVRPMYISSNVCRFFGYDEKEWLTSMQSLTPIREFVSKCHISYEDFLELLENREAEFHYTDVVSGRLRRIKAICSSPAEGAERNCYVMLYDVTDRGEEAAPARSDVSVPEVYIRTFGYFDVFVNDAPIAFRNEKAKELFALLVDRRGGFVTSGEAISVLWEDEPANAVTLARYRKVALRLKNTLEENGIAGIVESVDGKRRIVPQRVRCDLYEYLSGEAAHAQLFKGSYLQNYSWSEGTVAELTDAR